MEYTNSLPWFHRNNSQLFWVLQFTGWSLYGVIEFSFYLLLEQIGGLYCVFVASKNALMGMVISLILRALFNYFWCYDLTVRLLATALGTIACALLWHYFAFHCDIERLLDGEYLSSFWLTKAILTFGYWTFLYHSIKYYQLSSGHSQTLQKIATDNQLERLKRSRAEAKAREAQLKMLRYQLNPHFLFNTLNAISALVQIKQLSKANNVIVQLSQFLRYSLTNDPVQMVSLQKELGALKLYLNIEQTRFGDRLIIEFVIQSECDHVLIPSLILQPLVENAIKHGIAPNEAGGKLTVRASVDGSFLIIEISDTGPGPGVTKRNAGISSEVSSGVGLRNTTDRLRAFYGDCYKLNLMRTVAGGFKVEMRLPLDNLQ